MCKVKKEHTGTAIHRASFVGPDFAGHVSIADNANSNDNSKAGLIYIVVNFYSVPPAVKDQSTVLAGTQYFSPDEVEVFYLDPSR